MPVFSVSVRDLRQQLLFACEIEGELEIGRQQADEPSPIRLIDSDKTLRLIVAPFDERTIARHQLRVRPLDDLAAEITNLSDVSKVALESGTLLPPSATIVMALPVVLRLGSARELKISASTVSRELKSLDFETFRPGASFEGLGVFRVKEAFKQSDQGAKELIRALELMTDLFQTASSSQDFYIRACRAAIDLVGLDQCRVLLLENNEWRTVEQYQPSEQPVEPVSRFVVSQVLAHKTTFWRSGVGQHDLSQSLSNVQAVVAAPIMNSSGDVVGILYAERSLLSPVHGTAAELTQIHALLLELVACAAASGLTRIKSEDAARRMRLQFEQFFTPTLAKHLETHSDLLHGRDAEVSVLFADIRGFSRIAEKIGAARTFDWINDVMGTLSDCVLEHEGVLVDYIGDELMAMWGAPEVQPDHARRACLAAIAMIAKIPELRERWSEILKEPFDLGIGISSGPVRAGNMGSRRKFKYGPLGTTVNLASRVQGATKYFKSRLMVTGVTADAIGSEFLRRHIADVRVVNLDRPLRLYEILCGDIPQAAMLCQTYETALAHFEKRDFREAARLLSTLISADLDDGPSVILLSRAVDALITGPHRDHPVWQLPGK